MNELLNDDGTPSFQTIGNLRDNFETEFAKKELGAAMTNIIVKATPDRNDKTSVYDDDNIKALLSSAIKEVSGAAYENKELNSSTFIGQVKETIDEFCGMEADYREQKAYALWNTATDKVEASKEIREMFSVEDLTFSKEIKERFESAMEIKHGQEGEDIVISIGKEVGAALAQAEEKNIIINETSKVIADQKKEMEQELQISDDDAEAFGNDGKASETDDSGDGEEPSDTSTEFDNDEPDSDDDIGSEDDEDTDGEGNEEGSEGLNDVMGQERLIGLNKEERKEALAFFNSKRTSIEGAFKKFWAKLDKKLDSLDPNKESVSKHFDTQKEFDDSIHEKIEKVYTALNNKKGLFGNSRTKFEMKLFTVKGMETWKYFASFLLSCFPPVGSLIAIVLILTDEDEKNAEKVIKETVDAADSEIECKIYLRQIMTDGKNLTYDVFLKVKFNLKKFWQQGGMEDTNPRKLLLCGVEDTDVIVQNLADNLDERIVNGEVLIGEYKPDQNPDEINTTDVSNPEITGADGEGKVNEKQTAETGIDPNDGSEKSGLTTGDNNDDGIARASELPSKSATLNEMSAEDFKQYRQELYKNENIGKVLVPLSPVQFDSLPEYSTEALTSIFARNTEGLESLSSIMNGRFEMLSELVEKERDSDLTAKFNDYRARATEALNEAELVISAMENVHVTPFGLEDIDDPTNLYVGAKFYHFAKGDLKISQQTPKRKWEGLEDGINAVFDLLNIKHAIRVAHDNKDYDTIKGLAPEVASRESVCYENLMNIPDDDSKKQEIQNLLKLEELEFDPSDIVAPEFLTSIKIALDTTKAKTTKCGISDEEAEKAIHERAKNRIEFITQHDITADQDEIITAMIEGRDISDYAPTPFEKFVLKESKDEVKDSGDPELGAESAGRILDRACVCSVLHSFVNSCKPMSESKTKEFNEYLFGKEW
ncbi:MAG: hypothetical protein IJ772_05425 [Bacilli bacterium]|nr:hypothetical protein [Bacilli bacterium]